MTLPPLVVTGASGFVGRRLVGLLRERASTAPRDVTLLVRDAAALAPLGALPPGWRVVRLDLATDPPPDGAIPPGSVVLHLAAATGRSSRAQLRAVNVEGTRRLATGARAAGASHLVFVSSIAASFTNRRWYHYAEAKLEAERAVAESGVPFTIVRPTMVFGAGSPVQEGLARIATGGAPVVPGSGAVQVQPILADDLATFLLSLSDAPPPSGVTVEVGGGARCTLGELLAHMRAARGLPPRRPWPVPLAPIRVALAVAEALLGPRLPVTAGQLASFVNDSVAAPHELVAKHLPHPRPLSAMLGETAGVAPAAVASTATAPSAAPERVLASEFGVLARYLGTGAPSPRDAAAYVRAHPSIGASGDVLDDWLVAVARRTAMGCALAEAYARVARPRGTLRRKLVLALAVLESSPGVHAEYDTARPSGAATAWLAMVALGTGWAVRTAIAIVVFAPLHLAAYAARGRSRDG